MALLWRYLEGATGHDPGFEAPAFDDSAWATGYAAFARNDLGSYPVFATPWVGANNEITMRTHLSIPPGVRSVTLHFWIDYSGSVWVNGALVATVGSPNTVGMPPTPMGGGLSIPLASWLDGDNVIAVRAYADPPGHNYVHLTVASIVGGVNPDSAPRGLSGAPEYVIEIYDSGATFGPNTKLAEVWDARNIGWSRYDRLPGKAFFTLAQSSANLPLLTPLLTHIAIWRITPNGDTLVYRGVYVDSNNTGDDVILDCFDYKSLLSVSRSGFKTLYPTKLLGTEIVSPEWALAKGATSSPLGFITTGTIEDPLALDNVTAIKTNAQFGTLDQTRLQLFYDLSEMGRANTANQVTFDIDLTNTFHFYKNRGVASGLALVLGGNISDYGYLPGWARYRNDVATVGVATAGGSSEIVATNAAEITAKGRRQDVTTLKTLAGIGGGATETDQQKAALERDLKRLVQQQSGLMLRVERGKVEPFVGYELNDTALIEIGNGIDTITGTRRITGVRCLFAEAGEDIDLLVSQVAS